MLAIAHPQDQNNGRFIPVLMRNVNGASVIVCRQCNKEKSAVEFYLRRPDTDAEKINLRRSDYSHLCRECTSHRNGLADKNTPGPKQWKYWKYRGIGFTREQYNQLFADQLGACAICRTHQSEFKKPLCVDHDHESGVVRGLLCSQCNLMLGNARDDAEVLATAIVYLKSLRSGNQ